MYFAPLLAKPEPGVSQPAQTNLSCALPPPTPESPSLLLNIASRLVLAGEGIWDCFGVFRGDIWALTEQGPPKVVRMSRFC
jgi:hypothetical protein